MNNAIATQTILKTATGQSLFSKDKELAIISNDPKQFKTLKAIPFPSKTPWETRI